jgi:NAD+ synthase
MTTQAEIIRALNVSPTFEPATELERRLAFLKAQLLRSGLQCFILGISGGVDSLTAGLLAQRAVREMRSSGIDARFVAVRLPHGQQADASDANRAVDVINPDIAYEIDIALATSALWRSLEAGGFAANSPAQADFLRGNVKARQRMVVQYALAGGLNGMVIGTDHAAEAVMGFFTKFGDGAADITPLAGLTKRRVRALAAHLGAPPDLVGKVPTADLEELSPLRPDEDAYGVTYDEIDDFLEGKSVPTEVSDLIIARYRATAHKRHLPIAPE